MGSGQVDRDVGAKHEVDMCSDRLVRRLCWQKPGEELFEAAVGLAVAVGDLHDDHVRIRAQVEPVRLVQPIGER